VTIDEFRQSLKDKEPPPGCSSLLQALWYEAQGDWNRAHTIAQDVPTPAGSRVHAYLHRKEGDLENARYWYRRAGEPVSLAPPDTEWDEIVNRLLADANP
jgi:hypothetical protein